MNAALPITIRRELKELYSWLTSECITKNLDFSGSFRQPVITYHPENNYATELDGIRAVSIQTL